MVLSFVTQTRKYGAFTAACKFPRPKITISHNFRKLHEHVLDRTDIHVLVY